MSDIKQLRAVLFDVLTGLKEGTIEIDKAKAINEISQTIINSARVEVDYIKATDSSVGTGFIQLDKITKIGNVTTHRIS